jgi:hypothetical protein
MFKNPLTSLVVSNFLSHYQSLQPAGSASSTPYVYVDLNGVKFVTQVVNGKKFQGKDSVFALSMCGDGWMEMLAMDDTEF